MTPEQMQAEIEATRAAAQHLQARLKELELERDELAFRNAALLQKLEAERCVTRALKFQMRDQ